MRSGYGRFLMTDNTCPKLLVTREFDGDDHLLFFRKQSRGGVRYANICAKIESVNML